MKRIYDIYTTVKTTYAKHLRTNNSFVMCVPMTNFSHILVPVTTTSCLASIIRCSNVCYAHAVPLSLPWLDNLDKEQQNQYEYPENIHVLKNANRQNWKKEACWFNFSKKKNSLHKEGWQSHLSNGFSHTYLPIKE